MVGFRVLALCLAALWCTACAESKRPSNTDVADVFSAVLEHKFADSSIRSITILNRSSHFGDTRYSALYGDNFLEGKGSEQLLVIKEQFLDISDELACEFLRVFSTEHRFEHELELTTSRPIEVVDEPIGEWPIYGQFSHVAFDASGRHAFVLFDFSCGALCGSGDHFLLHKDDNRWRVIKEYPGWRS